MIALNHAVALSMHAGPAAGLVELERPELRAALADYHLFHAARSELLRRLGRRIDAREAGARALSRATTAPERQLLRGRLEALAADG